MVIRIVLEREAPPVGVLMGKRRDAQVHRELRFVGWLGLLRALGSLLEEEPSGQAGGSASHELGPR